MIKRKRALPIGVLVVTLLVMLASIGVVSSLWSKNLTVDGTVETGDLRVDWTSAVGFDDICTDFNPLFDDCGVPKDVGKFVCEVDEGDAQILHFEASNTYPSYEADCEYHFTNTGSIPWIVRGAEIIPGPRLTNCVDGPGAPLTIVLACRQLTIGYFDNVGVQVDPGNQVTGSIKIHVEQEAEQSDCTAESGELFGLIVVGNIQCNPNTLVTYEFDIFVCVAQWNEAATYDECKDSEQHEGPEVALDRIVDADGITTAGDGLGSCGLPATPGSLDVSVGDPLTAWPTGGGGEGIDILEGVVDNAWTFGCNGDDIHLEDPGGSCGASAFRDGFFNQVVGGANDCKVLDHNGSLADGDHVECDLEGGAFCSGTLLTDLKFFDANGSTHYENGEDIVLDVNGNGIFD